MSAQLVVGTQWGDEGKAKLIDYLSNSTDIIVRYQGGANAGHTVKVNEREYIFHLIPSGILYPNTTCVLGNGVAIDPIAFTKELDLLQKQNITNIEKRLIISDVAHIVLPVHKLLDLSNEKQAGKQKIGTTGRGIGVCYSDKMSRIGIRIMDVLDREHLKKRLDYILPLKLSQLQNTVDEKITDASLNPDWILSQLLDFGKRIKPLVRNTAFFLHQAIEQSQNILLEGAQGTGLDIDFGTYPYVTSSNTTTGGALTGSGLSFRHIKSAIGICKSYVTRVGEGPFPTELHGAEGERMRKHGKEFGATTGRPRRCGWFDTELIRHSIRVNGLDSIALTKLDVLSNYKEIAIGTSYYYKEENGSKRPMPYFPSSLENIQVEYEVLPGWETDITKARKLNELPKNCRNYIDRLENLMGTPIKFISVGPERSETIVV